MSVLKSTGGALGWCLLLSLVVPFVTATVLGLSVPAVLGLIASAFLIEYGAAPIGIALGLPPAYVLFTVICIEAGIYLVLYGIIDTFGQASGWVAGFLGKTKALAQRSRLFDRYGIFGLFPCEILLGVYVCAPVSRLFGWPRAKSFAITMAGFCAAAVITTLTTVGIIRLFFT
ncbi:MAG: small multi-drug export protein [Methanoregula sp.]|nr:small multi-drug export protein [Methanoregula sp.]